MEFIKRKFPSLMHKNYRMFWMLEVFSLIGVWIQTISQSWLIYELTNLPFYLGLVGAMQVIPVLLLSLFAGVIIDNFSKRKVLMITQYSLATLALIVGILVLSGYVQYWHILIFALLVGIINTVDIPTKQAIITEFVGKDDVMNAVSLSSTTYNIARIIGPSLAGILLNCIGMGNCFIITALLYVPILIFLTRIGKGKVEKKQISVNSIFKDVADGFKYILSKKMIYGLIFIVVVIGIFALNYGVFIPVAAREILNKGSMEYGNLMSFLGIGAFLGCVLVGLRSKKPSVKIILCGVIGMASMLIISAFAKTFMVFAIILLITGFCDNIFFTNAQSILTINSSDEYRGRVLSVYTLAFAGTSALGNLFCGSLIDRFSLKGTYVVFGVSIVAITSVFLMAQRYFSRVSEDAVSESA